MLPATTKNLRSFGFTMAVALLALGALLLWRTGMEARGIIAGLIASAALAFAGLAALKPEKLAVVYRPWMALAHYMGIAMTHVIMTVFFFTLLVPFTLIRLQDPLRLRLGASSYWERHRNAEPSMERFRRPF